jgi:hypothetical protein
MIHVNKPSCPQSLPITSLEHPVTDYSALVISPCHGIFHPLVFKGFNIEVLAVMAVT